MLTDELNYGCGLPHKSNTAVWWPKSLLHPNGIQSTCFIHTSIHPSKLSLELIIMVITMLIGINVIFPCVFYCHSGFICLIYFYALKMVTCLIEKYVFKYVYFNFKLLLFLSWMWGRKPLKMYLLNICCTSAVDIITAKAVILLNEKTWCEELIGS